MGSVRFADADDACLTQGQSTSCLLCMPGPRCGGSARAAHAHDACPDKRAADANYACPDSSMGELSEHLMLTMHARPRRRARAKDPDAGDACPDRGGGEVPELLMLVMLSLARQGC